MNKNEEELSRYIDKLNAEKKPNVQHTAEEDQELNELFETVKAVRSLKEPTMPNGDFTKKLAANSTRRMSEMQKGKGGRSKWYISAAAVAAIVIMALLFNFISPISRLNIVSAMERAYKGVKAYHGMLEIVETNQEGTATLQSRLEVWADKDGRYYSKQLEGSQDGLVTANNGRIKWQLKPDEKESILFSAFPDPYRYTFELGEEIDHAKNALDTKVIGEETIAGRKTTILEVTPQGGSAYKLWIDKETKLPLQKESAMQNALQYKVTYTDIDMADAIPEQLMAYSLPEGFKEISTDSEQIVNNLEEAQDVAGFFPKLPESLPSGYSLDGIAIETISKSIKLYYVSKNQSNRVLIIQKQNDEDFVAASGAVLGKVGGNNAEIQSPVREGVGILGGGAYAGVANMSSVRWQQDGFEYAVIGDVSLETISGFIKSLTDGEVKIPVEEARAQFKPQIEVPVDLEVERNDQKSVDAGHSPWRLDPVFVAQVFASLKLSPEGIVGDYPIKTEELKMTYNTGSEAIVEVSGDKTVVTKVYLKRLIRQDETGIWTVVGYDPVK